VRVYLDTNVLMSAVATRGLCADVLHVVVAEHQLVAGEAEIATDPPSLAIAIRDLDDMAILSEAVAGKAEVLDTDDRDLLEITMHAPLPIVTTRGFWEFLRAPS
jgi:predicted nucleic acid-binding protein